MRAGTRLGASVIAVVITLACHRTAAVSSATASLAGSQWTLTELGGHPAGTGAGNQPATLLFSATEPRVSGFAGCNRMGGNYTAKDNTVRIGPLIMTRMACQEGMTLEQSYGQTLDKVTAFRMTDTSLELLVGDTVVARFSRQ